MDELPENACQNCLQDEAVVTVQGYRVCADCEIQVQLPWYLRD